MAATSFSTGQVLALGSPALLVGLVWLWRSRPPLGWTAVVGFLMPLAVYLGVRFVALPLAVLVDEQGW